MPNRRFNWRHSGVSILMLEDIFCFYLRSLRQKQPYRGVLRKGFPGTCIKIKGERRCQNSPVNLLHIFKIPFPKNTSGWLFLVWFRQKFIPYNFTKFISWYEWISMFTYFQLTRMFNSDVNNNFWKQKDESVGRERCFFFKIL